LTYEVCVDSPHGVIAADRAGADRVELCSALMVGGLTPSIAQITAATGSVRQARVHVLIRPRPGDFRYDDIELSVMRADISVAASAGAHGVVFGALTPEGHVDMEIHRRPVAAHHDEVPEPDLGDVGFRVPAWPGCRPIADEELIRAVMAADPDRP
jgi:copper homeostasis protein